MADRQTQLLEEILGKVDNLDTRIGNLEQGQKALEQGQKTLQADVQDLKLGQGALSTALQKHAATTDQKLDDLRETLTGVMSHGYDVHEERITALEEAVGIKPRKH